MAPHGAVRTDDAREAEPRHELRHLEVLDGEKPLVQALFKISAGQTMSVKVPDVGGWQSWECQPLPSLVSELAIVPVLA